MMSSPSINPLPPPAPFSILPPSSFPSSSATNSISLNSHRLITTKTISSLSPILIKVNTVRRQFKMIGSVKVDDNLGIRYDSRSNPCLRAAYAQSGFLTSDNSQFEKAVPGDIRGRIENDFVTVPFQKGSNNNYKRMIERKESVQQNEPLSSGLLTRPAGKPVATRLFSHSTG